jgi:hypothetical protein
MLPHIEHIHDGVLDIHQRAGAFLKVNGPWLAGIPQACVNIKVFQKADRKKQLHVTIFLF